MAQGSRWEVEALQFEVWGLGDSTDAARMRPSPAFMKRELNYISGRGTARAEDAQGTPTQSHISPSILVNEEKSREANLCPTRLGGRRTTSAPSSLLLSSLELRDKKSMSITYGPASEPLHISEK